MTTRAQVLFSGAATALLGGPLLAQFAAAAEAADAGDIGILNAALELERAGIKAYDDAAATGLLSKDVAAVAMGFKADHQAHRDALIGAIRSGGGTPSQKTAVLEYPALKSQTDILHFAKTVEEKAAVTYLSVVSEFKDRKLAEVAASILGVETTHVALLASVLGELPAYKSGFVS